MPSAVLVAPNGDIFVGDGQGPGSNARIVKFDAHGEYLMTCADTRFGSPASRCRGTHFKSVLNAI